MNVEKPHICLLYGSPCAPLLSPWLGEVKRREKFKSIKATRGRDPYNVAGEFWRVVVVVDGDGVEGLHGVGVVVDGESVVGGVLPCLRPHTPVLPCGRTRRAAGRSPTSNN